MRFQHIYTCIFSPCLRLVLLCGALLMVPSCWRATFVQTDPTFRPGASGALPEVYVDRLPGVPYRPVGIIEIQGPAGDFSLDRVLAEVQIKGAEIGCQLLVDRAIHRVSLRSLPRHPIVLARAAARPYGSYYSTAPTTHVYTQEAPPGRREFICAVWGSP